MDTLFIENNIKYSSTKEVLNFPVGLGIYLFNPYRLCNISPNGSWKNGGQKLEGDFSRFLAYARINKLEEEPIGPGLEVLSNNASRKTLEKLKEVIKTPNARLVWEIFWLDGVQEQYQDFPRSLENINIEGLSDHNKAVLYHFQAILRTLDLVGSEEKSLPIETWENALKYWNSTLVDASYWKNIESILEEEIKPKYPQFKDFFIDKIREELIDAIYNTAVSVPLNLIEREKSFERHQTLLIQMLGIILSADLGSEETRNRFGRILVENWISKIALRNSVDFKSLADAGNYRKLYKEGMKFLDEIHQITSEIIKKHSFADHGATTFFQGLKSIPGIHTRVVNPLEKAIESNIVLQKNLDREKLDKTLFTKLILGLRMICELNLDPGRVSKIIEGVEQILKRFNLNRFTDKQLQELNKEVILTGDIVNPGIGGRYYLAQYCFFLGGEFAHPDHSLFKSFEHTRGMIVFTERTVIPRSELGAMYHQNKMTSSDIAKEIRNSDKDLSLATLEKALIKDREALKSKLKEWEANQVKYQKLKEEIDRKEKEKSREIEEKVEKKKKELEKESQFLAQFRALEIDLKKIGEEEARLDQESGKRIRKYKKQSRIYSGLLLFSLVLLAARFLPYSALDFMVPGLSENYFIKDPISILITILVLLVAIVVFSIVRKYKLDTAQNEEQKIKEPLSVLQSKKQNIKYKKSLIHASIEKSARAHYQDAIEKLDEKKKSAMTQLESQYHGNKLKSDIEVGKQRLETIQRELAAIEKSRKEKFIIKDLGATNNHPAVVRLQK